MNMALGSFLLSLSVYLLGVLAAKTLIPNVKSLATWLKKTRSKNIGVGIQAIVLPYHRLAFLIGMGNLTFGLLLVFSGVLFGLPPLILLFRSTLLAWGILDSNLLDIVRQERNYFRFLILFLAVVEALLFILWTSIGVGIGLSVVALLIGQSGIVVRQKPLLAALPWVMIGMVLTHIVDALLETHVMVTFKPELIQSFFRRPAGTADGQELTPTEKELAT